MNGLRQGLIAAVVLGALLPAASGGAAAADLFAAGIDDLPLMPGLVQVGDRSSVFDSPAGRVAEITASGRVSPDEVRAFYSRTLPQLGWRALGHDRYGREGETLRLEFPGPAAPLVVRLFLAPG